MSCRQNVSGFYSIYLAPASHLQRQNTPQNPFLAVRQALHHVVHTIRIARIAPTEDLGQV
jgi:hypothetical protein